MTTLKEWLTLDHLCPDPLPRPERHVCSFRRSTKRYIAVEVTFMGTERRAGGKSTALQFIQTQNRKGKSQMQQPPPPPPLPLCNDSDSWKTNLAIKEGNEGRERATGRRKRSEEKRAEGEGEIELDFPTFFCLFGAKKKTRPRGERRRGRSGRQTERRWLSSPSSGKFFSPALAARSTRTHAFRHFH